MSATLELRALGDEIELAYGKSLPAQQRLSGSVPVYGSNGVVGFHDAALVPGPGIVVGRKGSLGEVAFSHEAFWPIDTTYYVVRRRPHHWRFLYHLLRSAGLTGLNSHSAVPGLNREAAYALQAWFPDETEQRAIAHVLDAAESALTENRLIEQRSHALKRAAMRELFAKGLRGEARKKTAMGLVPASWHIKRLDECANVVSTRMQYSELEASDPNANAGVHVHGIKVSDMNAPGNEVRIQTAALERRLPIEVAERKCAPPGTIVFPKRGAAIATNKKRLLDHWTVFDPNLIGVIAKPELDQTFLFHWFQQFDLRTITEPGPTPQLNKKNLDPLLVAYPSEPLEQKEIITALDAIDRKIALHKKKRGRLEALFEALLHKLMTGEVRVQDLNLGALKGETPEAA